jgi:hypothetical protein
MTVREGGANLICCSAKVESTYLSGSVKVLVSGKGRYSLTSLAARMKVESNSLDDSNKGLIVLRIC